MSDAAEIFKVSHTYRGVPAHLAGTDRVLQRWAASIGDGFSEISWNEIVRSKIPPLDDQCAIVVDQLVLRAPERTKTIAQVWYRSPQPTGAIAQKLRIDRTVVYYYWTTALEYFLRRFEDSPLSALRRMATLDVKALEK